MENKLYIDIILFAVVAGVLAANLYRILGKKTHTTSHILEEKEADNTIKSNNRSSEDNVKKYVEKYNTASFKKNFIIGANEAFKLIVSSFQNNNLDSIKNLLTEEVYENFANERTYLEDKPQKIYDVVSVESKILNVEIKKEFVFIKVEFKSIQVKSSEKVIEDKDERKLIDVWNFKKPTNSSNPNWILTEVSSN